MVLFTMMLRNGVKFQNESCMQGLYGNRKKNDQKNNNNVDKITELGKCKKNKK